MEKEIKYQDWPEMVKITTALSHKKFIFKHYKVSKTLGYLLLIMGIPVIIYAFVQSENQSFMYFLNPLCIIVIGIANIISGNSIKWIAENSSWEERFNHKSSSYHKFIYLAITLFLLLCLYGFIKS